jgi:hypothetical protein
MYGQNPYSQYPYTGYAYPNYGNRQFMQPQQTQMAQPQMQQAQQSPMQYETPIQDIRFVTSEEAKAFIVMPNSKALLIDQRGGVAHLKTADNMGQSVTQYFKFEQVNADGSPIKPQEPTPKIDFEQFARKEELNGFVTMEQYNALLTKLEVMQKIITGSKSNINGTSTTKQGN